MLFRKAKSPLVENHCLDWKWSHWSPTLADTVMLPKHSICSPTFPSSLQLIEAMGQVLANDLRVEAMCFSSRLRQWRAHARFPSLSLLLSLWPRRPSGPSIWQVDRMAALPSGWVPEWLYEQRLHQPVLDMQGPQGANLCCVKLLRFWGLVCYPSEASLSWGIHMP